MTACTRASPCLASPVAYAQAEDDPQGDTMTFSFDSGDDDGAKDFEVNLMNIDCEELAILDSEYTATVRMPSSKFQRIIRCAIFDISSTLAGVH